MTPENVCDEPPTGDDPSGGLDPNAILRQLKRILSDPAFSNSKRYPVLLRYVVEKSIEGGTGDLRERTLGVQVFGRDPDYDTNTDPVVRMTAGEVRKRLAQYYHDRGAEDEIRIDIPLGSYVPEFSRLVSEAPDQAKRKQLSAVVLRRRLGRALGVFGLIGLAVAAVFFYRPWAADSDLDRFWRSTVDAPDPVLICLGRDGVSTLLSKTSENSSAGIGLHIPPDLRTILQGLTQSVALSDATTLARIAGTLQAKGKKYTIQMEASTTFSQLRAGPVVLIGAFNNEWTLRLTQQLRFSFQSDPESRALWIGDKQSPAVRRGAVGLSPSNEPSGEDYAIVSRVRDLTTDRIVTVAAGVNSFGTTAAGEFLSTPEYMAQLRSAAPRGWEHQNVQIVLATRVIEGSSGPPRVVATHFW